MTRAIAPNGARPSHCLGAGRPKSAHSRRRSANGRVKAISFVRMASRAAARASTYRTRCRQVAAGVSREER